MDIDSVNIHILAENYQSSRKNS